MMLLKGRRFAPPTSMTIAVIPAFCILLALGTWQSQRLVWKQNLIAQYQTNVRAAVVAWSDIAEQATALPRPNPDPHEFRRVSLTGTFQHDKEMYLTGRSRDGKPGLLVITPFRLTDNTVVAVNRGWIESDFRRPDTRQDGLFDQQVTLEAMYRRAVPVSGLRAAVLPDNDVQQNTWYTFDLPAMRQFVGLPLQTAYYFMDAREGEPKPYGKQWLLRLHNNHLQYAVTWYLLAVGLLVVYVLYGRKRAQELAE